MGGACTAGAKATSGKTLPQLAEEEMNTSDTRDDVSFSGRCGRCLVGNRAGGEMLAKESVEEIRLTRQTESDGSFKGDPRIRIKGEI